MALAIARAAGEHAGMWMFLRGLVFAAAVAAAPFTAQAAEMTFRLIDFGDPAKCRSACPQVIAADGEIRSSTPQAFLDFIGSKIASGRLHSIVLINSQGGQVVASMELGRAFRTIGAAVIVARAPPGRAVTDGAVYSGRCYSACVYALMGAATRVAPPQSKVGIHRMFMFESNRTPDTPAGLSRVYAAAPLVARLSDYAQAMGVSPELVWTAEKIDPDKIRVLSGTEMRRWKLAAPKL
jgi:hypothetical protein